MSKTHIFISSFKHQCHRLLKRRKFSLDK